MSVMKMWSVCDRCGFNYKRRQLTKESTGWVVCRSCYDLMQEERVSSGHAQYGRDRDFEDRQADIVQPYTKDGKPSSDFARLYPDKARELFSDKDMREAL